MVLKKLLNNIEDENVRKILPAHNDFNLEPDFVRKVQAGFELIKSQGLLKPAAVFLHLKALAYNYKLCEIQ